MVRVAGLAGLAGPAGLVGLVGLGEGDEDAVTVVTP
jgi:hypothetical protein